MKLQARQRGQTIIEYALLIALISGVVIAIGWALGKGTRDVYVTVNDAMITASGDSVAAAPPTPEPEPDPDPDPDTGSDPPDNPYQGQMDFADGWYKALRNQGPIPGTNQYYGTDLGHNIASGAALGRMRQQMLQGGASEAEAAAAYAATGQYLDSTYN